MAKTKAAAPALPRMPDIPGHDKTAGDDAFSFNLLLSWTRAVVETYRRYQTADTSRMDHMELREAIVRGGGDSVVEWSRANEDEEREQEHRAIFERSFFLNAAQQMFRYRNWVVERGLVKEDVFAEVDKFKGLVTRLRNMHEHADEYFKTDGQGGKFPHDWWHIDDAGGIQDMSATHNGKFGGLLDPKEVTAAAERLFPRLVELDSSYRGPTARRAQDERMKAHREGRSASG